MPPRPFHPIAETDTTVTLGGSTWADEYERLRQRLQALSAEPAPDMAAIDAVMAQLDETHAAFKAEHRTDDHQRY